MMLTEDQRFDLLIELRRKGITQTYVADQVGISQSALSQYFSNKTNLTTSNEDKLLDVVKNAKTYRWKKVLVED